MVAPDRGRFYELFPVPARTAGAWLQLYGAIEMAPAINGGAQIMAGKRQHSASIHDNSFEFPRDVQGALIKESYMRIVSDMAGIQAARPLVDTEHGTTQTTGNPALFQTGVSFQPTLQVAGPLATRADGTTTLPDDFRMPFFIQQGEGGGASGTTTLAEIMAYLGKNVSQADIDKEIRRTGIDLTFAPEDMIDFARENGLKAEGYNNGTLDELKAMIDDGHPVQARLNNGNYISITGYGTDANTGEGYVVYHDSHLGTEQRMSVSDFEKKWGPSDDGLIHLDGYNNYFIAYGDHGADLPRGRDEGIEGTLGYSNGLANLANGLDRIVHPDGWGSEVHGIFETMGGIPQSIGSYFGSVFQGGGQWLNGAVDGIPVLQNFVKPIGDLANGAGAVVADVFNGIGESFDDFGGAIEDLSHGNWDAFTDRMADSVVDLGSGVVDAGRDAVGAVEDAIGDLFSW